MLNDMQVKNNKGISIIEALVSITIISVGIIGIMSLILQSIQVRYINKNTLIASQLAQEGMEIIRNTRDRNWLQGNFYASSTAKEGQTYTYAVDISDLVGTNPNFVPVTDINDAETKLKICDGLYHSNSYSCSNATSTTFKRMITTNMDQTASSVQVICLIQWKDKSNTFQFSARELLYNWTGL